MDQALKLINNKKPNIEIPIVDLKDELTEDEINNLSQFIITQSNENSNDSNGSNTSPKKRNNDNDTKILISGQLSKQDIIDKGDATKSVQSASLNAETVLSEISNSNTHA